VPSLRRPHDRFHEESFSETDRRRAIQVAYNEANGITPESIVRPLEMSLARIIEADYADLTDVETEGLPDFKSQDELEAYIKKLESDMREAAKRFEFEKAAKLRTRSRTCGPKNFYLRNTRSPCYTVFVSQKDRLRNDP